jgi:hypothetical protein
LRQGPHQEAQKSIKTILPFSFESLIVLPFGATNEISGALEVVNCKGELSFDDWKAQITPAINAIAKNIFFIILFF